MNLAPKPKLVKATVNTVLRDTDMTLGELQILTVLTTMQYLALLGPKSPGPEQIAKCVQQAMQKLQQVKIFCPPQAVFGYVDLDWSRGPSVKTEVSTADVSSLHLSITSAGDLVKIQD